MTLTYIKSDLTKIDGGVECVDIHYLDNGREPGWEYSSFTASCSLSLRDCYLELPESKSYQAWVAGIGAMLCAIDQDADARVLIGLAHISL
jgi:hypothetical protein